MPKQIQGSQHDFSFGEVDPDLKRNDDHPARKAGLRQMANARIRNSGSFQNRSGRTALFPLTVGNRTEEVTLPPGNLFKLVFAAGSLQVFNSAGIAVAQFNTQGGGAALPWAAATIGSIVFVQFRLSIYITFPGMLPQVLSWDGVAAWSISDYTELVFGSQKRTWFYRITPQNVAILPSAQTGNITVLAQINGTATNIFTPAWVGTRIRFVNRQILITGFVSGNQVNATVEEPLPGAEDLGFTVDPRSTFSIGDEVTGSVTGSKGIVTSTTSGTIRVQLISTNSTVVTVNYSQQQTVAFTTADTIVGPSGSLPCGSASAITAPNVSVTFWDEEVMNPLRGYPASCFVDNFRLGFCNFPAVPNGIGWSAINSPTDLYVGGPAVPNGAMFEVAPANVQVYYVVPGPESSEFVFCDHKVYYIPISPTNPLVPGSVAFQILSSDGAARVQPRAAMEVIFYVNAGGNSVMAVTAPGAYYRPFNTKNLTNFSSHLFTNITALAAPNADGSFNERYVYALNAGGALVCGKYDVDDGKITSIGWGPWSGVGAISWVSATNADVLFTTSYSGSVVCEILDDTQYLDAALPVNNLPASFAAPAGKGPLWFFPGQTVSLMDQVTRSMGTYQIDANGNIIPQNNGGENLAAASLVAGQPWTLMAEPFPVDASSGTDMHQRMTLRQISNFGVSFLNSTGFVFASLFCSKQTRTSPPLGTVTNTRRVPAWNQDDDATKPPPLREYVEFYSPQGSSFDPRVAIIKDTPGPFEVVELSMEITL